MGKVSADADLPRELSSDRAPADPSLAKPEGRTEGASARAVVAITRIRFRRSWDALSAIRRFYGLYRGARAEAGFLRGQVAVAGPYTLVNVSLWRDVRSMLLWSGGQQHVEAVQWTYGRTAEVWSGYFVLLHQSSSAVVWDGTPIQAVPKADLTSGLFEPGEIRQ